MTLNAIENTQTKLLSLLKIIACSRHFLVALQSHGTLGRCHCNVQGCKRSLWLVLCCLPPIQIPWMYPSTIHARCSKASMCEIATVRTVLFCCFRRFFNPSLTTDNCTQQDPVAKKCFSWRLHGSLSFAVLIGLYKGRLVPQKTINPHYSEQCDLEDKSLNTGWRIVF